MRLKPAVEGVTDLSPVGAENLGRQLSCCYELWSVCLVAVSGSDSSRAISSLRPSLQWGLQGQTFLVLAAVRLFGLCTADLARKPARYRSLPRCPHQPALSFGSDRSCPSQHFGRCAGRARLAHLRRLGQT